MTYGKTIELFLVNGVADGLVTAELSNWNGLAIKVPRTDIPKYSRNDLKNPGVYFLFCEENGEDSVYIGEAENILERLLQHIRDYRSSKEKYYWTSVVAFTGRDLNKAHIRYLEDRFVKIARDSGKYTVLTKNTYGNTILKESQIASMEEFIDNVKILINVLGYKVLDVAENDNDNEELILFCSGNGGVGKGFISSGGFTVLKGSRISDHITNSFSSCNYNNLRSRLLMNEVIVDGVFAKDYEFNAPSAASAVILGRTSNGNVDWKTKDGIKLKDL